MICDDGKRKRADGSNYFTIILILFGVLFLDCIHLIADVEKFSTAFTKMNCKNDAHGWYPLVADIDLERQSDLKRISLFL